MRLALVHGFTQSARSWDPLRAGLRIAGFDVVTPELAGHGCAATVRADLAADADRMATEVGHAVWVGYSMGGRVCLRLALDRPQCVDGLVLVSTTAGLETAAERAARRASDETLAASIEDSGVAAFMQRWLAAPMWASLPAESAGLDARLTNTGPGLASSLRLAGTGTQEPLWGRLAEIHARVLVISGALDTKFDALGDRLAAGLTSAEVTRVSMPGTGHALPWEQPEAFVGELVGWRGAIQAEIPQRSAIQAPAPQRGAIED